ncbi:MAG: Peptidase M23 family protein [Candidatus Nomurabacteria bacterium GW2011_GWE1_32_28]|uniref:Peptidase M23 family protein n=1 Tax=Candidatus Nomurabacteria bacterium GW2011_GWF1_31_48 TaxID=1618767 RepID=A0A0F9YGL6_9BACT|nr:MAG: Peptidase M23 family protein [Candidatus Nomurabacteria bacterium GW2011_GWF2_30_133]KKP29022.1 MAG: Peptidase M23 family protein [Candidatus Nomurabacteria bacterium GW2011_GWE2_31_40]KKP30568.1 MAG: Peptidase M23 family protein [Candidatus Nomurabacteria bacterium GW2011_GWF1_31_48]KKP35053.1 MAG: Peptidase M23 family protein [Candidatus Nomurabacteria bacterium GW2011_GWE1_32_28]
MLVPFVFSYAETIEELNNKIGQKNIDITKLEQEIALYQSQINNLGKQKSSLSSSIKQLDLSKKKLIADISITQNKIDKTNLTIQELSLNINDKEDIILNNSNVIALDIRRMNELEQNDLIETILSENDFTIIWNDIENMSSISNALIEMTTKLKKVKNNLEYTKKETTDAKNELITLKSKLNDQKKIVEQNTKEKNKLLTQTKNSETSYQKLLKDRLAKKEAFEKEVEGYESQIKFILNPSLLPQKGVLSWPLDYVYITQLFGVTKDSKRLYASGSHSGVDFRASIGTPVKSVADGVVVGVGDTDKTCPYASFGKFIFIKHNNGLSTTYGHLSLIKVSEGQKIKRGDIIGYSGNTGHTTGPHLHLTVYASEAAKMETRPSKACEGRSYTMPIAPTNAYLDPMYYLPSLQ